MKNALAYEEVANRVKDLVRQIGNEDPFIVERLFDYALLGLGKYEIVEVVKKLSDEELDRLAGLSVDMEIFIRYFRNVAEQMRAVLVPQIDKVNYFRAVAARAEGSEDNSEGIMYNADIIGLREGSAVKFFLKQENYTLGPEIGRIPIEAVCG